MTDHLASRLSRRTVMKNAFLASAAAALPTFARPALMAAQGTASPVPMADVAAFFPALDDFVVQRMTELQVPGVAVGVLVGEREHAAGFGVTNLDHPLPVDAETLFQIGSTSKTFTSTALMRLVEQRALDLEAPVRTYLPDFHVADAEVSAQVRLKHLVTHTAGWYGDDFTDTGDGDDALTKYVTAMADLPQIAPLGRYFSYNNAAVALAGHIIEVVTDQPFETAMTELVFTPLGLEQTYFFPKEIMTKVFAVGHASSPDDPDGAPRVVPEWALPRPVNPAGGEISSVTDQLRYARFHLGDGTVDGTQVLSAASLAEMKRPHGPGGSLGPYVLDGVGLSWLLTAVGGERVAMHGGSTNGQQSSFLLLPDRDFAITVLTNSQSGAILAEETALWALEHLYGLVLPEPEPIEVATEQLAEYVADYDFGGHLIISVTEADGELTLSAKQYGQTIPESEGPLPLVDTDRAVSDFAGAPVLTDFVRDDAGEVAWIRFSGRLAPRLP